MRLPDGNRTRRLRGRRGTPSHLEVVRDLPNPSVMQRIEIVPLEEPDHGDTPAHRLPIIGVTAELIDLTAVEDPETAAPQPVSKPHAGLLVVPPQPDWVMRLDAE